MTQKWTEHDDEDLWTLQPDELSLLAGMTDKGRLGFAFQLKFRQISGRFPAREDEIQPAAIHRLATQLGVQSTTLSTYKLGSRQGQRHRQVIRDFLGYRLPSSGDLARMGKWLTEDVLPFDPRAHHGRDLAFDWCQAQRLEPPALDHLDRLIYSAVHLYEARLQETIVVRLSAASKAAIDQLLASEEPEAGEDGVNDPGRRPQPSAISNGSSFPKFS
jgi:Domain of unknown function (DUF4158)